MVEIRRHDAACLCPDDLTRWIYVQGPYPAAAAGLARKSGTSVTTHTLSDTLVYVYNVSRTHPQDIAYWGNVQPEQWNMDEFLVQAHNL
jgi:hypothetical protein